MTTTGIEPVCSFYQQQSNVVAYLRWRKAAAARDDVTSW
jgi:hypothetical protein